MLVGRGVLLGSLLVGCGGAAATPAPVTPAPVTPAPVTPAPVTPASPTLALPAFALLGEDAILHVRPDATSPWARISRAPVDLLRRPLAAHAVKALAVDGDWIQIETGARTPCHHALLQGLAVRLYVHRDALVPVTTRELVVTDPDGTGVQVAAGTPIVGEATPRLRALGWIVAPPLTREVQAAIGRVFQPSPELPDPAGEGGPVIDADLDLELFGMRVEAARPSREVRTVRVLAEGDPALVEITGRCVGLRARVAADRVQRAGVVGGMLSGYGRGRPPAQRLRQDAELWWEDGAPAGRVIGIVDVAASRAVGDRRCASFPLGYRPGVQDLTLCFQPQDILPVPAER